MRGLKRIIFAILILGTGGTFAGTPSFEDKNMFCSAGEALKSLMDGRLINFEVDVCASDEKTCLSAQSFYDKDINEQMELLGKVLLFTVYKKLPEEDLRITERNIVYVYNEIVANIYAIANALHHQSYEFQKRYDLGEDLITFVHKVIPKEENEDKNKKENEKPHPQKQKDVTLLSLREDVQAWNFMNLGLLCEMNKVLALNTLELVLNSAQILAVQNKQDLRESEDETIN